MKKWYCYENEEVIGPFSKEELVERISPNTLLCPAGKEDWKPAKEYPEMKEYLESEPSPPEADAQQTADEPTSSELQLPQTDSTVEKSNKKETEKQPTKIEEDDQNPNKTNPSEDPLEPTLETLTRIAREANSEDLLREFKHHWSEYDREEQKIIYLEMKHLGIHPDQQNS